jgi:glycogen debranching enzyme
MTSTYVFVGEIESAADKEHKVTVSAGQPYFANGWTRCWGRDTFISFKGGLLIPGMFEEAKSVILMFASCLRHGLIPNLLDGGRSPRYNCRDATWWFVKAVGDYLDFTKDYAILDTHIRMKFLANDLKDHEAKIFNGEIKILSLAEIIQEIFQVIKVKLIHFRLM